MSPRIRAFLIHLAISLCILAVLLVIIYKIWYPQPFFSGDGGWQGMRLVASVDIILGPLLTLIVYNTKKPGKELRRDLSIIALVQIFALSAGTWIVYQQRTQLITFTKNYFTSLSKYQLDILDIPSEKLKEIQSQKPPVAFIKIPENLTKLANEVGRYTQIDALRSRGDLFEPLNTENLRIMLESGYDLRLVAESLENKKAVINAFLDEFPDPQHQYVLIPIVQRYQNMSLVFNRQNGELVDALPITYSELLPLTTQKHKSQ